MLSNNDIIKLRSIGIEQVAEACNLTVKRHTSLCPFHSDTRPSLTFNVKKNLYRCFVCDAKGGPIDLVMHMMNLSFYDACHWLAQTFSIILDDDTERQFKNITPRKVKPAKPSLSPSLSQIDVRHLATLMCQPYLNDEAKKFLFDERKIKPEVVKQLGLSSISSPVPMSGDLNGSWFNAPSLLIPYRDIDGKLISVQARYLGNDKSKPRFQFPKGSKCSIFNLPALELLQREEHIFISEGVTDCLALMSAGFKAIAIPSATLLKPEDKMLLSSLSSTLSLHWHIYPDRDKPGEKLFLDLIELLSPSTGGAGGGLVVRHQLPEGFKDIGQYYAYLHREEAVKPLNS